MNSLKYKNIVFSLKIVLPCYSLGLLSFSNHYWINYNVYGNSNSFHSCRNYIMYYAGITMKV